MYVDGGSIILQFSAAGLLADTVVSLVPVLLGESVPLFGKVPHDLRVELVDSRFWSSCGRGGTLLAFSNLR